MIIFLTSSLAVHNTSDIFKENHLIDNLLNEIPKECKVTFICSNFEDYKNNDYFSNETFESLEKIGLNLISKQVLDLRTINQKDQLINQSDLLILSGGHVPTQNAYFKQYDIQLHHYQGVIISISAGSMNLATNVYSIPEEKGEAIDPNYKRYLTGLSLTNLNIIPHFQYLNTQYLDGFHMINDLALEDSVNKVFYGLDDGSYILIKDNENILYGIGYEIKDKSITQICDINQSVKL